MTTVERLREILFLTFGFGKIFFLEDIYKVTIPILSITNPSNKTPRALIRRDLQIIRDSGKLIFVGGGKYVLNT
jgi:hypothetical protein